MHADGKAERFYRALREPALIGLEATGNCHWLIDLLSELVRLDNAFALIDGTPVMTDVAAANSF